MVRRLARPDQLCFSEVLVVVTPVDGLGLAHSRRGVNQGASRASLDADRAMLDRQRCSVRGAAERTRHYDHLIRRILVLLGAPTLVLELHSGEVCLLRGP